MYQYMALPNWTFSKKVFQVVKARGKKIIVIYCYFLIIRYIPIKLHTL